MLRVVLFATMNVLEVLKKHSIRDDRTMETLLRLRPLVKNVLDQLTESRSRNENSLWDDPVR